MTITDLLESFTIEELRQLRLDESDLVKIDRVLTDMYNATIYLDELIDGGKAE